MDDDEVGIETGDGSGAPAKSAKSRGGLLKARLVQEERRDSPSSPDERGDCWGLSPPKRPLNRFAIMGDACDCGLDR